MLILWVCAATPVFGQEMTVRETLWRAGDNKDWANPGVDETGWRSIAEFRGAPVGVFWIRESIRLDHTADTDGYALSFEGAGAFDAFFDGVRLGGSGLVGADFATERPGSTHFVLGLPASMATKGEHVLALRASAANLSSPDKFFVEYRLRKTSAAIGDIAFSMSALGGAAASAFILMYFFWAGSFGKTNRNAFIAAIALAFGVMIIVAVEAVENAGRVPYTVRGATEFAATSGALAVFAALPAYLILRFRFHRPLFWAAGVLAIFLLSMPSWPGLRLEHDARAFALLCGFGLIACAAAFRTQGRQIFPFSIAFALLLGAIMIAPQSLYLFLVFLSIFLSISFADFSRRQQLLVKQAEATAARLEAEMLRRNIQPHFLMNSLTAISEWIETAPVDALRFVDGLAEEFRSLSKLSSKQLAPLSEEVDLCRVHLDLMGMRQRRRFTLKCAGLDTDETVPPGIFHTLLENAISHNRYRGPEIRFDLTFSRAANEKTYVLSTPLGEGTNHSAKSTGTGLQYVKSRLEGSYPGRWRFSSEPEGDAWVSRISIRT